jgi:hypothetical protein
MWRGFIDEGSDHHCSRKSTACVIIAYWDWLHLGDGKSNGVTNNVEKEGHT